MAFLQTLLTWANLPFTAALGIVLVFAALQVTGVLGLLAGEGEADGDADADVDAEADVGLDAHVDGGGDHDVESDVDHDVAGEHDADHDADGHGQRGFSILGSVGVGRLPTSIVWQTFAMSFGMLGVVANSIVWMTTGVLPVGALAISLPAGFFGGYALTALIARTLARVVKPPQEAPGRRDLVGLTGVVVSGQIDEQFGEVRVKASHGEFVQVPCRLLPGERPVGHHENVVIVNYDKATDRLYVAPVSAESAEPTPIATRLHS